MAAAATSRASLAQDTGLSFIASQKGIEETYL